MLFNYTSIAKKINAETVFSSVLCKYQYTGTNFNRPGFQAMLEDIEMGYVTTVMIKDLSRLGRDYVSVGHYISIPSVNKTTEE
ncbi:MAG: recombinase family protein [Clostridia bacterium]|nr:recombinase family protein [Clostridia bacterium]